MRIPEEHCDVVVVGARCAGAATAMLLARMGHQVVLLDRSRVLHDTVSTHGIARGGVVQLSRWGLLDAVLSSGAPAVRQVTFRVGDHERTRAIKGRAGVDMLVAPRRHVLDPLLVQAAEDAGVTVRLGVTVTGVERDATGRVRGVRGIDRCRGEVLVTARVVVGADGIRSAMAGHLGGPVLATRPRNSATFYTYARDTGAIGYEFHVADGAMAGAFPTHGEEACVWLCATGGALEPVRSAGAARAAALVQAISSVSPTLADRLRGGAVTAPVRGVVGLPNHVRRAAGPGWALVGDAGYHRDPVTGHGITDAFRDAELLAGSLDRALRGEATDAQALQDYQHRRDDTLREVFALTCDLAAYPPAERFVALQKQLSDAFEAEADALAALPSLVAA